MTLPEFRTTKIMTWECHVDDSAKGRYNMILDRYILAKLVLNIKLFKHSIEAGYGPLKGSTSPMIDLSVYEFKYLNTGNITPEESLMNSYIAEVYELEQVHTSTK